MSTSITIWNTLVVVFGIIGLIVSILVMFFGGLCLIFLVKEWLNKYKNKAIVVEEVKTEEVLKTEDKETVAIEAIMEEVHKKAVLVQEMVCVNFEKNNRILKLYGSVEGASGWLTRAMLALDAESSEDITLIIDSGGGAVDAGRLIIEVMNLLRSDVSTIIIGKACSMAADIAISGAKGKRYATKSSKIMIHEPALSFRDASATYRSYDLNKYSAGLCKDREEFINLIVEHTKESREEIIDKFLKGDTWMDAEEALKLGYIDGILVKGLLSGERIIQR